MTDEMLTAQETADRLGYHINHVYRLLRYGIIHGKQWNRVWMIPLSEVDRVKAMQDEEGKLPSGTLPR
jgi:hypothetical protein